MPKFLTTQANMAVFPLITVTLVGVVASMKGTDVAASSAVVPPNVMASGCSDVTSSSWGKCRATDGGPVYGGRLLSILGSSLCVQSDRSSGTPLVVDVTA